MTKTTYHVPGFKGTRTSERPYTHAIIGCRDLAAVRRHISRVWENDKHNARYMLQCANAQPGDRHPAATNKPFHADWVIKAEEIEEAREHLGGATTPDQFAEAQRLARVERHAAEYGDRDLGNAVVLQWSMSAANAGKGMSQWTSRGYIGLTIVECAPVEKKAKAK